MINQEELDALKDVINYILYNEENSFDEWISMGNNGEDHIYSKAVILDGLFGRLES